MKGEELRRLMKQIGDNADQLAERLGVHRSTVFRWLANEFPIPVATGKLVRILAKQKRGAAA